MTDLASPPVDSHSGPGNANSHDDASEAGWIGLVSLVGLLLALGVFAGINWLVVVVAVIFMIFMHEMGHYLTARLTGMKVTEFFLGFGPKVWSFKRGETEYGIKAIWAGAYVRIIGMSNLEEVDPVDETRTYRQQSYPKRILVASAGSAMHFLMAILLLFTSFMLYGRANESAWDVRSVSVSSAAEDLGLAEGDRVVSLDGQRVGKFDDFSAMVRERGGDIVTIEFERNGELMSGEARIRERLTDEGQAGIEGLVEFDRIVQVDGVDVDSYAEFVSVVDGRFNQPMSAIVIDAYGDLLKLDNEVVVRDLADSDVATSGFLGVGGQTAKDDLGVVGSARYAVTDFGSVVVDSATGLVRFFSPSGISTYVSNSFGGRNNTDSVVATAPEREGDATALDSSNPDENRILSIYGAVRIGADLADTGYDNAIYLLILLNVFVGVFNLVPLLPLDGGHIAVATYERLRSVGGRRYFVDQGKLLPLTYAVVTLLVSIGLMALIRDIVDPVNLG